MTGRQDLLGGPDFDAWPGGEDVPLDEQIAEVEREIRMRRGIYAAWIRKGTMTEAKAEKQLGAMLAVRRSLVRLRETKAAMR